MGRGPACCRRCSICRLCLCQPLQVGRAVKGRLSVGGCSTGESPCCRQAPVATRFARATRQDYINIELDSHRNALIRVRSRGALHRSSLRTVSVRLSSSCMLPRALLHACSQRMGSAAARLSCLTRAASTRFIGGWPAAGPGADLVRCTRAPCCTNPLLHGPCRQPKIAACLPLPCALQLDLVLTSFSASVALVTAITGLFAMNVMLNPGQVRSRTCAAQVAGWLVRRTSAAAAGSRAACRTCCMCAAEAGLPPVQLPLAAAASLPPPHCPVVPTPRLLPRPAGGPGTLLLVPGRVNLHRHWRHRCVCWRHGLLPLEAPHLAGLAGGSVAGSRRRCLSLRWTACMARWQRACTCPCWRRRAVAAASGFPTLGSCSAAPHAPCYTVLSFVLLQPLSCTPLRLVHSNFSPSSALSPWLPPSR